jgi:hypothetical protein
VRTLHSLEQSGRVRLHIRPGATTRSFNALFTAKNGPASRHFFRTAFFATVDVYLLPGFFSMAPSVEDQLKISFLLAQGNKEEELAYE